MARIKNIVANDSNSELFHVAFTNYKGDKKGKALLSLKQLRILFKNSNIPYDSFIKRDNETKEVSIVDNQKLTINLGWLKGAEVDDSDITWQDKGADYIGSDGKTHKAKQEGYIIEVLDIVVDRTAAKDELATKIVYGDVVSNNTSNIKLPVDSKIASE